MHHHKFFLIISMFFVGISSKSIVGMERLSIENKCKHKIKINCIVTVPNHTYEVRSYSSFDIKIPAGKKTENLRLMEYVKVNIKGLQTKDLVDVALTRSLVINQDKNNLKELEINGFAFPLVKVK